MENLPIIKSRSNDSQMDEVKEISKYLSIGGMFQYRNGFNYEVADNINVDPFTFKMYDLPIRKNSHDMLEIVINTTDVSLLGSSSSIVKQKEALSNFQIAFDTGRL